MSGNLKVAEARARFGEILDEAESGNSVVIERRGVRFRLIAEVPVVPRAGKPLFDHVDAAVLGGDWTWTPGAKGLRFSSRKRR